MDKKLGKEIGLFRFAIVKALLLFAVGLFICSETFAAEEDQLVKSCLIKYDDIIRQKSHEKYGTEDPCTDYKAHAQALCQSVKLTALQQRLDQLRKRANNKMRNNSNNIGAEFDVQFIKLKNWKAKVRENCESDEKIGGGPYNAWTPVNIMSCEIAATCERLERVEKFLKM